MGKVKSKKVENKKLDLLRFWNKLEYINPASLLKGYKSLSGIELPWENQISKDREYVLYFDVFDSSTLFDFVREHFQSEEKDENEPNEKYVSGIIELDFQGKYITGSLVVSFLPFALEQLKQNDIEESDWEGAFEKKIKAINEDVNRFLLGADAEPRVLTLHHLTHIQNCIQAHFSWNSGQKLSTIYFTSSSIQKKQHRKKTSVIVNSPFTKDLDRIIKSGSKFKFPPALDQYLSGGLNQVPHHRVDLRQNYDVLKRNLIPEKYPDGCWPSKYTLCLMQQFAVNHVINELSGENLSSNLFSVNGPPGSGKTTLLRDIVAAIVVNKAKAQAKIEDPTTVFSEELKIETWDKSREYNFYPVGKKFKEITDFGMLISSSNNGAVENITRELPLKKEIHGFEEEATYFTDFAEHFSDGANWGLISAVLGNRENIAGFVQTLTDSENGLLKYLEEHRQYSLDHWQETVAQFEMKQEEVEHEKASIRKLIENVEQLNLRVHNKAVALTKVASLEKELENTQNRHAELLRSQKECNQVLQDLLTSKVAAEQSRPGFWHRLFRTKKFNVYHDQLELLSHEIKSAQNEIDSIDYAFIQNKDAQKECYHEIQETNSQIHILTEEITVLERRIQADERTKEPNFIASNYWINVNSKESQERCPWYFGKLKKLQSELFLLALKVNESFIHTANGVEGSPVSTNLMLFALLNSKDSQLKVTYPQCAGLWANLFLIVPVVSGTFASIQTMLGQLVQGTIPWLFVDEAGQALPQMACGAIWRSKRTIVVGDPLQIEPVDTMPSILKHHLAESYNLKGKDLNGNESVQNLADNMNHYGASIKVGQRTTWIGTPLKVHRRCINPMFNIANAIAYDNTMVCATVEKEPALQMETGFIHVEGQVSGRHYVPMQGEVVLQLIKQEISSFGKLPNIYVISPFSEVAREVINLLNVQLPLNFRTIEEKEIREWISKSVGTVHTFQGKQAEGVILCLGCDKTKISAANWAASKPNMLNVAITRSKYRFVAVGDKKIWLKLPFFRELSILLDGIG